MPAGGVQQGGRGPWSTHTRNPGLRDCVLQVMSHCVESEQSDCIEGAELILGLRMASWADTASSAPSPRSVPSPLPVVAESEEERSDGGCRPEAVAHGAAAQAGGRGGCNDELWPSL